MTEQERDCVLLLDEMAIKPSYEFDSRTGSVIGHCTIPGSKNKSMDDTMATHAFVLMLCGLTTRWKQVVAYYFTGDSFSAEQIKKIILEIITKASEYNFKVLNVTMDMGGGNQGVLREFGVSCKVSRATNDDGTLTSQALIKNTYPHPAFENEQLTFMPDVPHLLKNIRNHLTRGQVIYLPDYVVVDNNLASNSVSITFIKELLQHDSLHSLKIAPHLSEKALDPGHFDKMKVSLARNLLSRKTGAALRFLMQEGVIGHSASATAWFCDQIGLWYDLMTSRSTSMGLSLFDMQKHAEAVTFLESIIKLFTEVKIGSEAKPTWKPVQSGTILATKTALQLQNCLVLEKGYKFLLMSRFSQDALENLFSMVRFKNPIPTALEFKNALRIITVSQCITGKTTSSYEADDSEQCTSILDISLPSTYNNDLLPSELTDDLHISLTEAAGLEYLGGYAVHQFIKLNRHCDTCVKALTIPPPVPLQHDYAQHQSLVQLRDYTKQALVYISPAVNQLLERQLRKSSKQMRKTS